MPKSSPKKTEPKEQGSIDVASTKKVADTGSRPIIVTNRPMVEDPMVIKAKVQDEKVVNNKTAASDLSSATNKTNLAKSGRKGMVIQPVEELKDEQKTEQKEDDSSVADEKETPKNEEQKAAIEKAEEAVEEAITPKDEEKETSDDEDQPEESPGITDEEKTEPEEKSEDEQTTEPEENEDADSGLVDELAKQAASKKLQQEEDKVTALQREKVQELIAAKTYFVPIAQVTKRRVKVGLILAVALIVLTVVGLNFAIDAGLLDIGINPLTNFL